MSGRRRPRAAAAALLAAILLVTGCGGGKDVPARTRHPDTLEALLRDLVKANLDGDAARVKEITLSMLPTTADLRAVLREGPATDAFLAKFPAKDLSESALVDVALVEAGERTRTEVRVHAATTEELAAYARGTVAASEFPQGMQRFARDVAAPGRTWYCAEFVEPGKDSGTRYTCFTRLGDRFLIVVKPWRSLPADGR
jgi:hypothetical protein